MGAGYFPRLLGILLVVLGALQRCAASGRSSEATARWRLRPLLIVLFGVSVFILLAPRLGLVLAALALVLISSAASAEVRWREALISGAIQGLAAAAVFVYGLDTAARVAAGS